MVIFSMLTEFYLTPITVPTLSNSKNSKTVALSVGVDQFSLSSRGSSLYQK